MRVLLALFALFCAGMPSARAEPVALTPYVGDFVIMEVDIEGQSARLLFDTGAGVTSISPAFAARIGCTPAGSIAGFRTGGERVVFQKCADVSVAVGGTTRRARAGRVRPRHTASAGLAPSRRRRWARHFRRR